MSFWRLWKVVPLDSCWTRQDVSFSFSGSFALKNPFPQASPWFWHMLPSRLLRSGTAERYVQVSPKLLSLDKIFYCVESVMLWRGIMGFTKFGDKRVNEWIFFQVMSLELNACTAEINAGGSSCSLFPLYLSDLFFTCRFFLQCFVPLFSSFFLIRTSPCAKNFSELFFGDTKCKKPRHTLKTFLCCARSIEKAMTTHLICCFLICKKPHLGFAVLQKLKLKMTSSKRGPNCQKRKQMSRRKKNSSECVGLPCYSFH